jgi:hypothetical protein
MNGSGIQHTPSRHWWRDPPILAALLAVAFGLWELPFASFMADDFMQLAVLEGVAPVSWIGPFNLYSLSDGDPQHIQLLKDAGAMPWFFDPGFKMTFFRPLSSALLVLDHYLFGLHPTGYHAHVVLWFLVLVMCLGKLYGRVWRAAVVPGEAAASTNPTATLAALIFTMSSVQGMFCWTAARHIVIAAALGLLALLSHIRWREDGWRPGRGLSVAGFALSLCASEAALGMIAYVLAYEALGAPGNARRRLRASLPVVGMLVAYFLMYRLLGLGTSAGSEYLDPLRDPYTYIIQLPGRLVFIIGAMLLGNDADLWVVRPDFRPAMILTAGVMTLLGGVLLRAVWPTCSATERRNTPWLIAGSALAAIPFAGSPIGARCILIPWIGGAVVIALVLNHWWTTLRLRPGLSNRLLGALCWGLATIHLVLAPVGRLAAPFVFRQMMFRNLAYAMEDPSLSSERLAGRTLVIPNAPAFPIGLHALPFRQLYRLPMPAAWRVLSWAHCAHRFRRTAADAMEMELVDGEMNAPHLFKGEVIEVAGMQATVAELSRHGPTRVRFRFDRSLDDPQFVFLVWRDGRLQPIAPPAIGATLDVLPGNLL